MEVPDDDANHLTGGTL